MKIMQKGMLVVVVANVLGIVVSVIRSIYLNGMGVVSVIFGYRAAFDLILATLMCYRVIACGALYEKVGQSGKNLTPVITLNVMGMLMLVVDLLLFWQETFTPGYDGINSALGYLGTLLVFHVAEGMMRKLAG